MDMGRTTIAMSAQGLLSPVSRDYTYGSSPSQRKMNDFLSALGQKVEESGNEDMKTAEEVVQSDLERKQQKLSEKQDIQQQLEDMRRQLENSRKEAEAMEDEFEIFSKCMKIAARIQRGDIVPMKDMKYLAEHDPDMYKQAILLRIPNDHPKKHKSIIEDEDDKSEETQSSDSADSTSEEGSGEAVEAAGESASAETSSEE